MHRGRPRERKACTTSGIPPSAVRVSSSGSGSSSKSKGEAVGEGLGILRIGGRTQQFSHPAGEKSCNIPPLPPTPGRPCLRAAPALRPWSACTSSLLPADWGSTNYLAKRDRSEVCPLSGELMSAYTDRKSVVWG